MKVNQLLGPGKSPAPRREVRRGGADIWFSRFAPTTGEWVQVHYVVAVLAMVRDSEFKGWMAFVEVDVCCMPPTCHHL